MTAIRWVSGVLAALGRRGPTRSQLRGRIRFLEQVRDGMRDGARRVQRERDELKAQVVSLQQSSRSLYRIPGTAFCRPAVTDREVSERSFVYRHELRRIAQQLRRWSDESHAGGWSTQQCKPMEALAAQIDQQHIGAQTGESHKRMLLRVAEQLRRWSDESTTGGWSTHQVKPMRALAARIEAATNAAHASPPRVAEYWDGWPA